MPRRGGNILGASGKGRPAVVENDTETMLRLLKTYPNVFGSLPSGQVFNLFPAVIFKPEDEGYGCYFDLAISATNPSSHNALAKIALSDGLDFARAYLIKAEVNFLYPKISDLDSIGLDSDEPTTESLDVIKNGIRSKPTVEVGGFENEGEVMDFATMALVAQKVLETSRNVNLGFVATQGRFKDAMELLLIPEPQG